MKVKLFKVYPMPDPSDLLHRFTALNVGILAALLTLSDTRLFAEDASPPNVVVILADDLGPALPSPRSEGQ